MSSLTTNYSFTLPTPGGDDDAWGAMLIDNWSDLDTLLFGTFRSASNLNAGILAPARISGNYAMTSLSIGAGSAAAPSLFILGDGDTGIYAGAANNLDFTAGGVRRATISAAGISARGASGNISAEGTTGFIGAGGAITGLDAGHITDGILPDSAFGGSYTLTNLTASGNITAGATVTSNEFVGDAGSAADPTYGFDGTVSGMYHIAGVGLGWSIGGGEQARLTSTGFTIPAGNSYSGSGSGLTSLPSASLTGTVSSARLSGSYTGITGVGALGVGSITSGFGNIDIGGSTFTGNAGGLVNVHADAVTGPGTLPTSVLGTDTAANTWAGERVSASTSSVGATVLAYDTVNRATGWGVTRDGDDLRLTNSAQGAGPSLPAGSVWKCMGYAVSGSGDGNRTCNWKRVS